VAENSMIIKIEADAIELTSVKDGMRSTKMTNLRAIQEVLTKDKSIVTPLLPGTPWGTKLYTRVNDRELIVVTTPPHVREVKYNFRDDGTAKVQTYKIPLPGFAWFISLRVSPGSDKRQYNHGMVYAIKNPIYTEQDTMYQFPFSNVDNSWMCWGDQRNPDLGNVASLTSLPDRFLTMEFNNHLDRAKYREFEAERGGNKIKLFKTSHLFEWLAEQQTEAEKTGKDADFKYDCLTPLHSFKEHTDNYVRDHLRG
jgi:hypothetical protein